MPETIEAFVSKLQADGVRAGQAAADKIRAEAEERAARIVAEAEAQAKKLIADAEAEREKILSRAETELNLAARDTVIRLQGSLSRALRSILMGAAREKLTDAAFIGDLLRQIVLQFTQADVAGRGTMSINVSPKMRDQLTQWAIETLHKDPKVSGHGVDLRGTLKADGFEYAVVDGTVEVTPESVVEVLSDIVGPALKEIVARAAAEDH
jgi:vacuolar-type H+-ATPase subunit H